MAGKDNGKAVLSSASGSNVNASIGDAVSDGSQKLGKAFGTAPYRSYVLNILLLVYVLNFIDRGLLSVVARPLKAEIGVSDTAWGLLTGFGFALLYTIVGIPVARLAERRNRVWIIAICLAIWSVMTALCGLSTEITIGGVVIGGFWVLLACRVGVGIGEAGCTPPANSLISDYYPSHLRSAALGYYAMGVTLGSMLANMIGGPVTDWFGWRAAFIILGLPGVLVGLLMIFTIKEPPRGYSEAPSADGVAVEPVAASFRAAMAEMMSKPSFWTMTAGATIAAFCGYAIGSFQSLYIQRTFDISAGQAAIWFNTPAYMAGALGTVALGVLASKLSHKSPTAIAWLAGLGLLLCVPFYFLAFTTTSMVLCVVGLGLGHAIKYGYLAAQYTISQGVVSVRARATATAVMLFLVNLLGYGLGPLVAGLVSDVYFRRELSTSEHGDTIVRALCDGAQEATTVAKRALNKVGGGDFGPDQIADALTTMKTPINMSQYEFCLSANASSTQMSMLTISCIYVAGAIAFLMCARTLKNDLVG